MELYGTLECPRTRRRRLTRGRVAVRVNDGERIGVALGDRHVGTVSPVVRSARDAIHVDEEIEVERDRIRKFRSLCRCGCIQELTVAYRYFLGCRGGKRVKSQVPIERAFRSRIRRIEGKLRISAQGRKDDLLLCDEKYRTAQRKHYRRYQRREQQCESPLSR